MRFCEAQGELCGLFFWEEIIFFGREGISPGHHHSFCEAPSPFDLLYFTHRVLKVYYYEYRQFVSIGSCYYEYINEIVILGLRVH